MTEDKMVGWHHRLDGHEFEQAPGIGDEQESLVCCSSWGCKELDMTERLNYYSLVAQMAKHLPAVRETRVQSLDWEDSLEEEMTTHSGILAWTIPWTEEAGELYSPWGLKESDMTERLILSLLHLYFTKVVIS